MDSRGLFVARLLDTGARALAAGVVDRLGDAGDFRGRLAEVEARIAHLAESVAVGTTGLFEAHVEWLRNAYEARRVPLELLDSSLAGLQDELDSQLGEDARAAVRPQLDAGRAVLRRDARPPASAIGSGPHRELARRFLLAQLEGRRDDALRLVESALADGASVSELEIEVLSAAQRELGLMWQRGEAQVAEEHLGSGIVEEALGLLGSRIRTSPRSDRRALVAGVCGNLHTFGARIVAHHLRLAGWTTDYLGGDLPAPELAWAARERAAQVVALSVMLPLHVRATARTIEELRAAELPIQILVGGPPFEQVPDLWRAVGADLGSSDVRTLAHEAERLVAG